MPSKRLLLSALILLSAWARIASACHPSLQALKAVADAVEEELEGSGDEGEGSGEGSGVIDWRSMLSGADDCLLLSSVCPVDADCIEAIQDPSGLWSCHDNPDFSLRVGNGDGPYEGIYCRGGAWTTPTGQSLDSVVAENPTVYCLRFVPVDL